MQVMSRCTTSSWRSRKCLVSMPARSLPMSSYAAVETTSPICTRSSSECCTDFQICILLVIVCKVLQQFHVDIRHILITYFCFPLIRAHTHTHSKVNGLCICFRQMDLGGRNSPSPTHARRATTSNVRSTLSPSPRSQRSGSVKLEDVSQHMAGMSVSNNPSFRRASNPVLAATRVMSPLASHTRQSLSPSPQPPPHPHSPPLSSGAENPPSLVEAAPLSSPPPPSPPSSPPSTNGMYRTTCIQTLHMYMYISYMYMYIIHSSQIHCNIILYCNVF